MWCLDSCDEPVIQFSQESDLVGTHPVGSYPCEVPVFGVEEAGESRDVLLGPEPGDRLGCQTPREIHFVTLDGLLVREVRGLVVAHGGLPPLDVLHHAGPA